MRLVKELGDWGRQLEPILTSDYMKKLGAHLSAGYKKKMVYPKADSIFDSFKKCQFKNIKVVIIGSEPVNDCRSTGLAFGNTYETTSVSPDLAKIWETVENNYKEELILDFDITLESWAKQGVLLLNTSLTSQKYKKFAHQKQWQQFTNEVIATISREKKDVIFLLWGNEAKKLDMLIDKEKHYVLKATNPLFEGVNIRRWDNNHFVEVNNILKSFNKPLIRWYKRYE
jgi:uracil-DNA glycosylase